MLKLMTVEFTPETILRGYTMGIFPMGNLDDDKIRWYSPDPRCIIELSEFHVPRRLSRTYRQKKYELKVDKDWDQVIKRCSRQDDEQGVWISDKIIDAYTQLHNLGYAHSVEAYYKGELAGGLYGISIGSAFMGESMFFNATDASKVCLIYLVNRLRKREFTLLDCQWNTPHLAKFGAREIPRNEYLIRLNKALEKKCTFI